VEKESPGLHNLLTSGFFAVGACEDFDALENACQEIRLKPGICDKVLFSVG
jgi:hypothetical protein